MYRIYIYISNHTTHSNIALVVCKTQSDIFVLREKFLELDREEQPSRGKGRLQTCKRRLLDNVSPAAASSIRRKKQRVVDSGHMSSSSSRFVLR